MKHNDILHPLPQIERQAAPLNNPFRYTPSSDVLIAQQQLMQHIEHLTTESRAIREELRLGKMMGVMVVVDSQGRYGFLAGFSGCMAGELEVAGFVPPIFGRGTQPEEFVKCDRTIAQLGREIAQAEQDEEYLRATAAHQELLRSTEREEQAMTLQYRESKRERDAARLSKSRSTEELQLESQRQKGAMKRRERELKAIVESSHLYINGMQQHIDSLKSRRRDLSFELQRKMFESYKLLNGLGESRSLLSIFEECGDRLPPSGAGECAAPKMLHYALLHNLRPVAMGEFWYGGSPRGEVRRHGEFYGACKSRCEPILGYMLQGVDVESLTPAEESRDLRKELQIIFEDQHLVLFNKPHGMLSVPGRGAAPSVASIARELYPSATGGMIVHRLDQDTSGLLLVAKSAEVHKALQRQFMERTLSKRYVAIVDGRIESDNGEIRLPLIVNINDRPRQMVDHERGKAALTTFEVLERNETTTRLRLTPHTGRTHQLRIHMAHQDGLNAPIVGDRLYGTQGDRMLLHAESIGFRHPISGEELHFCAAAPF